MPLQDATASLAGSSSMTAGPTVLAVALAAVVGVSSFTESAHDLDSAHASLAGNSTLTALAGHRWQAAASIAGLATTTATAEGTGAEHATMAATSFFFIDPTKTSIIPYFKSTAPVISGPTVAAIPKAIPGTQPTNATLGPTITVRSTQTGGVPNKG